MKQRFNHGKSTVAATQRVAGRRISDYGIRNAESQSAIRNPNSAFTLTELLVVITIIAILASLITAGAMNAMRRGREAAITLEIGQLNDALERFKTEMGGAYPPNVFPESLLTTAEVTTNRNNVKRFLTKARPRATEFEHTAALTTGNNNLQPILTTGIRPSEALVLWLSGFSSDQVRPMSGSDLEVLPSIHDEEQNTNLNDVITIDSFDAPLFDFDKDRLRLSRNADGTVRTIHVRGPGGTQEADILLYEYFPKGSEKPYVYFNTVDSPEMVVRSWDTDEFYYQDPKDNTQVMVPLKQMKKDAPSTGLTVANTEYVNQGKFQIFHAGVDDAWGDFSAAALAVDDNTGATLPGLGFPDGPFTGDMADTLTNFTTGTLESEQE